MRNRFYSVLIYLALSVSFFSQLSAYKYELAVCAIFQNEADYLKEWIEFHKLLGVEHFYLFENRSNDQYASVLAPYINRGEVTLWRWPHNHQEYAQITAYDHCVKCTSGQAKWVAFIDIDEFLFTVEDNDLRTFLVNYEHDQQVGGLCVNWQMYGTSYQPCIPPGELLIDTLTYKAEANYHKNHHIKTIIRPDRTICAIDPHRFKYKPGIKAIDPNGNQITSAFNGRAPIDRIRLNHYYCRAEDWAYGEKVDRLCRCHFWSKSGAKARIDNFNKVANDIEDNAIQVYSPDLRHVMGFR